MISSSAFSDKKLELKSGFRAALDAKERVKEEEEEGMWISENSGGFLDRFADLEGFNYIQELGEFPMLPLDTSHMHGLEGPHQLV